jgi:hypothetical protein
MEITVDQASEEISADLGGLSFDRMLVINGDQSDTRFYIDGEVETQAAPAVPPVKTWRNDEANLPLVAEMNRALAKRPFNSDIPGTLDDRPVSIEWSVGPDLPSGLCWKGGVAGAISQAACG